MNNITLLPNYEAMVVVQATGPGTAASIPFLVEAPPNDGAASLLLRGREVWPLAAFSVVLQKSADAGLSFTNAQTALDLHRGPQIVSPVAPGLYRLYVSELHGGWFADTFATVA